MSKRSHIDENLHKHYFLLLMQKKGYALLGILLAVLTAYSGVALLAVSGWFISAAALAGMSAITAHAFNFFTPGALVRGLSISRTAGRYAERIATHEATFRLISTLRANLFRTISQKSWFETPFNRHNLSSRLLQDINHIEEIYLSAIVPIVTALFVAKVYLLTLWIICPPALMWSLPFLLIAGVMMPAIYSYLVLEPEQQMHELKSQTWQKTHALLSSLRTLILFGQLGFYSHTILEQCDLTDKRETLAIQRQTFALLASQIITVGMTCVVFWQAIEAFINGQLEGAYLFMLLLLSLGVTDVLLSSIPAVASFWLGWIALERISNATAQSPSHNQNQTATVCHRAEAQSPHLESPYLEVSGLSYRYPGQTNSVFSDFSFKRSTPGWVWLNGPSGAGKSTLLHILSGFISPHSGIIIHSKDVTLMPQKIDILRSSLRQNLTLNLTYADEELWQVLDEVGLTDWARSLPEALDTWLGDGEWQVSGGEAKRIGLARVILQKGSILLLDEPFSGIDTEMAIQIYERLLELLDDKLVIISSHETFGHIHQHQKLTL